MKETRTLNFTAVSSMSNGILQPQLEVSASKDVNVLPSGQTAAAFASRGHYFHEKQSKLDKNYKKNAIYGGLDNLSDAINVLTEQHGNVAGGDIAPSAQDSNTQHQHYHVYIDTSVQRSFHLKHLMSSVFPSNFSIHQFYTTNKYLFICDTSALSKSSLQRNRKYVDVQWLHDSMREHRLLPLDKYALKRELTKKRVSHNANLNEFMAQSRLHLIGSWKYEMTKIYLDHLERAAEVLRKGKKICIGYDSLIAHVDMDCFFAMVSLRNYPELKGKPVAVSHSSSGSGDISSCNYIARERGVKAGMWMSSARKLCPNLVTVPYDFESYKKVSHQVYQILFRHCSVVQIVSIDEAYIDLSYQCKNDAEAMELITKMREDIEKETQCTASAGVCENILLARMVTKLSKPNGQQFLTKGNAISQLRMEPVRSIPGIGRALQRKLKQNHNITHIRDLCDLSRSELIQLFKEQLGDMLYRTSRGIDNRTLDPLPVRKSVHVEMNYGHRYKHHEEVLAFFKKLSEETSSRLREYKVKGKQIVLKLKKRQQGAGEPSKYMGTGRVDSMSKSESLADFTDNAEIIHHTLCQLYETIDVHPTDVRGLGCSIQQLDNYLCQDESNIHHTILKYFEKNDQLSKRTNVAEYHPQSMSQMDTNVFKQLPYNLQQEVLQVVKHKEQIKKGSNAPKTGSRKKRKSLSNSTSNQPRKKQKLEAKQYPLAYYEKKKAIEGGAYSQYDAQTMQELPSKMQAAIVQALHQKDILQKRKKRIQETYEDVNPLNSPHGMHEEGLCTLFDDGTEKDLRECRNAIERMITSGWIVKNASLFVELVMQFIRAQLADLMLDCASSLYQMVLEETKKAHENTKDAYLKDQLDLIAQKVVIHTRSLMREYCLGDDLETLS